MKKRLSVVLVVVMILSVFSSFVYADASKPLGQVLALVKVEKIEPGRDLALEIFNEYLTDAKITELEEEIPNYDGLKAGLVADGVTKKKVKALISIVEGLNSSDLGRIEELKAEAMDILGNDILGRIVEARGNAANLDFTYDIINRIINKTEIVKYDTYTKKFTINFNQYKSDSVLKGYLAEVFPTAFSVETINADLETAKSILTFILNEDTDFNPYKSDLRALLSGYTFYSTYSSEQSGGGSGGGGGGGGGSTPGPVTETPEVEKPKVQDGKAQIELGKDEVEVKEGTEGQLIVSVKAENVKAAVAALLEAVKGNSALKPVVVIKLDDVKTAAMEVTLPKDAMKALYENKVELVIESGALTYEIPADALSFALNSVADNAQVEFKSKVISQAEAQGLFVDENVSSTSKVIEFSLTIKDKNGNEIKRINNFGSKIRIGIQLETKDGNPDLLGIFYINETTNKLEFVGGKIQSNKIYMAVNHYSKFAVAEYQKNFADMANHWSKDYVESMVAKHVIDGFEGNVYKPEDELTRAQFAKLLVETLELEEVISRGEFADVSNNHWAKNYIATAKAAGIIGGYADGTFKPDQTVTRAEMAAMLANSLRLGKNASSSVLSQFTDKNDVPAWAVEYMAPVVQEKLLVGSNGVLNPVGNVTRAEAATIIYRVYNR